MSTPNGDDSDNIQTGQDAMDDEASAGSLGASDELEEALRQATESVEARAAERESGVVGSAADSADKVLLEVLSQELQSLKQKFEEIGRERDELQDRHLRLQAEFENFRRRGLKERQEAHNFGHQNLVKDLLPTVDNLDRAIEASSEDSGGVDLQVLLQGIELVRRELLGVLGKHGVTKIDASEKRFDPEVHEAMSQVVDDKVPAGTIVAVLEEGYQLKNRMLRPSRVVVSKQSESGEGENQEG